MDLDELFSRDDLSWLKSAQDDEFEGRRVERKENADPKVIAQAVSAFANTDGGLFVLGVSKTGSVVGLERTAAEKCLLELSSRVDVAAHRERLVELETGRVVVLLRVPRSDRRVVMTSDGKVFRRVGSSSKELTTEQVRLLKDTTLEQRFEDEPSRPLSAEACEPALAAELQRSLASVQERENSLELDLRNQHLVIGVGRPERPFLTNAGLLVVGLDPNREIPHAAVRVLKIEGAEERFGTERNVVKDEEFRGPVPQTIVSAREFIRAQLRDYEFLGPDGKFTTAPEYPVAAWEEALVNAVVHRSYSIGAQVFVRIFDDRLEVGSPGGFPGSISEDNLTSSQPRNPHLASALRHFRFVRLANEGTRRMREAMKKAGLSPPEFREVNRDHVVVTLRNDPTLREQLARGRVSSPAVWDEIATGLRDPLELFRRKAIDRWKSVTAEPPTSFQRVAAVYIKQQANPTRALELLARTPRELDDEVVDDLVGFALATECRWLEDEGVGRYLRGMCFWRPTTVEKILSFLETDWSRIRNGPLRTEDEANDRLPPQSHVRWSVQCLATNLDSSAAPDRALVERIDRAIAAYKSDVTRPLLELIHGSE